MARCVILGIWVVASLVFVPVLVVHHEVSLKLQGEGPGKFPFSNRYIVDKNRIVIDVALLFSQEMSCTSVRSALRAGKTTGTRRRTAFFCLSPPTSCPFCSSLPPTSAWAANCARPAFSPTIKTVKPINLFTIQRLC